MNLAEFYPTPKELVKKMVDAFDVREIQNILEPSAGMGHLIESFIAYRKKSNCWSEPEVRVDAVEIEEELQKTLQGKEFRVVHDDFLTYDTYKKYDLILMNPPFSNGDEHLLKAIEMQEDGGKIACILNAETIKNPYSNKRKLLMQKLEEHSAKIRFLTHGFSNAIRRTDVEIAVIQIDIPKSQKFSFLLNGLKKAKEEEFEEIAQNALVNGNQADALIELYNEEAKIGVRMIREYENLKGIAKIDDFIQLKINGGGELKDPINQYLWALRKEYWKQLFDLPIYKDNLTSNLKSELHYKIMELADYEFSYRNTRMMFLETFSQMVKALEATILKRFEYFSKHSMDDGSKNIHYFNGWKTNKSWKINKKVIVPLQAFDSWRIGRDTIGYHAKDLFVDLEKTFDYLDQGRTDILSQINRIFERINDNLNGLEHPFRNIETKYFTLTFYKKGTCHITFKDDDLLQKFNLFGSQRKGWLPPSYGKKYYEEMDEEEKVVIDEFEGKESYNKVMENKGFYIVDPEKLLLLEN